MEEEEEDEREGGEEEEKEGEEDEEETEGEEEFEEQNRGRFYGWRLKEAFRTHVWEVETGGKSTSWGQQHPRRFGGGGGKGKKK